MVGSPLIKDLENFNRQLFSKPLTHLTSDDLSTFTGKAMTTWGEVNDYKHFLPRMLELTATNNAPYDIEIIFSKLEYGNWQTWDEIEQKAIHEYMFALWENLLQDNTEKAEDEFSGYFYIIALHYPDLNELLKIWLAETHIASTKHLANFIFDERANIFDKPANSLSELKDWLLSETIIKRLEAAFFQYEKESFSERISWAEKILTDERRNSIKQ
ncbi:hypothetical protein A3860_11365 [Niastella vici]|uniref:Uncharacterized protein n=2 Tax=Niastella vici TaxID=1703345 RepID=A0A1V9FFM6_9BACT|nr:hypothetical protein A3860_11365 [Niastella vici]